VLLNLHAQAVSVQNIRALVPLLLDVTSTFYPRWRESFLLTVGKYSLNRHVLSDTGVPTSADWVRMDCVVRTWLLGTISDDLADTVSEHNTTARRMWLAIESQFLGNQATRALYADADFRAFSQGDLPVAEYCRLYKRKAEDLRDLGEPISDRTLVLNIIRGLNERFTTIGLHLRRTNPLPSFPQVRDDLRIEELTMEKAPPATALFTSSGGKSFTTARSPAPAPQPPPHQQVPPGSTHGGSSKRGKRGGRRGNGKGGGGGGGPSGSGGLPGHHGASGGGSAPPALGAGSSPAPGGPGWPSFQNPWAGSIHMWPGPRGPSAPHLAGPAQQPQALLAGFPGQWAGQWGVPAPAPGPAAYPSPALYNNAGWDQQALASQFQTLQLQQPAQQNWYFDTGATNHVASDAGILSPTTSSVHSPSSIVVGNGNLVPVTSTGTAHLSDNLHLNNVLVAPNLIKNLISVRQFTIDNNCTVEFDPFGCSVKDLPTRSEIVRCDSSGPLYPLHLPASALLASSPSSLWHQRLGHPGSEALSKLAISSVIKCNATTIDGLCHACQLGRHIRLPFHASSSRATHNF